MGNKSGTPKRPTEKEIATFKNLIKACQDYDSFCRYRQKLELKYGAQQIDDILAEDPEACYTENLDSRGQRLLRSF